MKMVLIAYNEAIEDEVMEALGGCCLKNYTKIPGTFGRGDSSGTHLGNDIWPGKNNMMFISCREEQAAQLIARIRELRKELGKEGLKAFVMPLEEVT